MLPNGDYVSSTSTAELLQLTDGMTNRSLAFVVTEVSALKMSKTSGYPYMQVFGINDEEEPLKLNIWGQAAVDKFQPVIKPGSLYKFTGVKVGATKPQFMYGHLPFDLHLYEWGFAELLRGDYKASGLPLKAANDIEPSIDWRIRCRGVIVENFTKYMRYGSALMGTIRVRHDLQFQVTLRSVPMAYINSFTKDTEVELVGHISLNGSVWDFDVMKWADVRNSSSIKRDNVSIPSLRNALSPAEKTPPTPQMPLASKFDFGQNHTLQNYQASAKAASSSKAMLPMMDRVVKHLYGKLYMGPKLVPYYYVQFKDSEKLEYVRCSEANISTAQKVAFDVNFEEDERRAGCFVRNKNAEKAGTSRPFGIRNLIAASNEHNTDGDSPTQPAKTGQVSQRTTAAPSHNDENDKYESSFINDSTPTFDSSSDSEPSAEAAKVKAVKKRKRAFLESDEEDSSDASPRKPAKPSPRTEHAASGIRIKGDGSASSKKSTASARYTPLIILGANGSAVEKRSDPSSPDIPVITLD